MFFTVGMVALSFASHGQNQLDKEIKVDKVRASVKEKFTIHGYVREKGSGEDLLGVNIFDVRSGKGTVSNYYGYYSLTLPSDSIHLKYSYVGYSEDSRLLFLNSDLEINIDLEAGQTLEEVVILSNKPIPLHEMTQMSSINLTSRQIESMPALGSEVDVLKVLQLLPGVQGGHEGSSGLFVRGGSQDQNLILLDGVPVYNAFHLFGFLSVFNSSAISNVELIKGSFPARYGGRLSSVIDIKMKEGNNQKLKGNATLGFISSKFTLEGPIKKGTTSFMVSGRRTLFDLVGKPFLNSRRGETGYNFYDLNIKLNHRFSSRDRVLFSIYNGRDKAFENEKFTTEDQNNPELPDRTENDASLRWGNTTSIIRWNHVISDKLFSNISLVYSDYTFRTKDRHLHEERSLEDTITVIRRLDAQSGIEDWSANMDFDFIPSPAHYIRWGGNIIAHNFTPGITAFESSFKMDTVVGALKTPATEYNLYFEDELTISSRFSANLGLRFSAFDVADSLYKSWQPRVGIRYLVFPGLAFKASYSKMIQFIHLLTNSGVGLPTDLWVPSTDQVEPQESNQYAAGLAFDLADQYQISLEGYFKQMNNLIEYEEGASFLNREANWEDKVEAGNGRAYGTELQIEKRFGRTTGWLGYTLSWSNRQFEVINQGRRFPFKFDRRHNFNLSLTHRLKDNVLLSGSWVYTSGIALTLPLQEYSGELILIARRGLGVLQDIEKRNGFRMRTTHRLDLSASFAKKKKHGERKWIVSIYNAYSRRNPFFIKREFRRDKDGVHRLRFIEQSYFPIIPSIAYQFNF